MAFVLHFFIVIFCLKRKRREKKCFFSIIAGSIWLYVIIVSRTSFRMNLHSRVA